MSTTKAVLKHENKFIKCIKAPIRMLSKARDMYVNSLTDCSGKMNYGGGAMGPVHVVPRSFSMASSRSSDDDDMRELVRAASQRGLREKLELDIRQTEKSAKKLPRSFTVGFGRIDEDKPYDFATEDSKAGNKKTPDLKFPRSRSAAVSKKPNPYALYD